MSSLNIYIVEDGKRLMINFLDDESLDSLKESIFECIPLYSKLLLYDDGKSQGIVSELNDIDFSILNDEVVKVQPSDTKTKKFGNVVLVFRLAEKTVFDVLKPYRENIKKKRCKYCNVKGHNIRSCAKRTQKMMNDWYRVNIVK